MSVLNDDIDDDDLTPVIELEADDVPETVADESDAEDGDEDEVSITLAGEESAPETNAVKEEAPEWVRELRRENKELKRQLHTQKVVTPTPKLVLGPKPTLESVDYDDERLADELEQWTRQKIAVEAQEADAAKAVEAKQAQWQATLGRYSQSKAAFKVKDFDVAEEVATDHLDDVQQAMIVSYADNAPAVIYALGKRPSKAKELSEIKDYAKFAFEIAKFERGIVVTSKKAPAPERIASGIAPTSGNAAQRHLEKLEAEADRTGNRSELIRYKKQLAAK